MRGSRELRVPVYREGTYTGPRALHHHLRTLVCRSEDPVCVFAEGSDRIGGNGTAARDRVLEEATGQRWHLIGSGSDDELEQIHV
jgi:hypothetical protein